MNFHTTKKTKKNKTEKEEKSSSSEQEREKLFGKKDCLKRTPPKTIEKQESVISTSTEGNGKDREAGDSRTKEDKEILKSGDETLTVKDQELMDTTTPTKKEEERPGWWDIPMLRDLALEKDTPPRMRSWSFDSIRRSTSENENKKRKRLGREDSGDTDTELNMEARELKESIEKIVKLIATLKENEEQNTKREIKQAIKELQREATILKTRDVEAMLSNNIEPRAVKKPETADAETQTETKEEREEREKEKTRDMIRKAQSLQDWKDIEEARWEETDFSRTKVVEGNPVWQQETLTRVIMAEKEDKDFKRSIQQHYIRAFPAIQEMTEDMEDLEIVTTNKIKGKETIKRERVIKVTIGETEDEIWEALTRLKQWTLTEQKIALHHLRNMKLSRFRKMLEVVFKGLDTEIELYTTRAKIEEEKEQKVQNQRRTYALIVAKPDSTYEEVVKDIKKHMQGRQETEVIRNVRQARDGRVIITMEKDMEAVKKIQKVLQKEVGRTVTGRGTRTGEDTKMIYIRGMAATTSQEDVKEAIRAKIRTLNENLLTMTPMRPYANSMLAVTLTMRKEDAEELVKEKRMRIGLAVCQIEERRAVKRCIKCWSPYHLVKDCTEEDKKGMCYNCGEEGHQSRICPNPTKCADCESRDHRAGSMRCNKVRRKEKQERYQIETDAIPEGNRKQTEKSTLKQRPIDGPEQLANVEGVDEVESGEETEGWIGPKRKGPRRKEKDKEYQTQQEKPVQQQQQGEKETHDTSQDIIKNTKDERDPELSTNKL